MESCGAWRALVVAGALVMALVGCGGPDGSAAGARTPSGAAATGAGRSASPTTSLPDPEEKVYVVFGSVDPQNPQVLEETAALMRRRAAEAGLAGVDVQVAGEGPAATITVSGRGSQQNGLRALGETARLDFRPVLATAPVERSACTRPDVTAAPEQPLTACEKRDGGHYSYSLDAVAVPGTDVAEAEAVHDERTRQGWLVRLRFTAAGAKKFTDVTGRLAQQQSPANQFAIVLDGTVLSAPSVSQAITGGEAEIYGSFTETSARELAADLRTGALPARLSEQSVTRLPPG
ncbi:SecDF P1 head subdomain-containing protein [Streptomyces sp. NPDC051913]|uniref:SecDF P1 head subdomain-containing protein n=1 Tax=Streptomyces sp. NPDC051913 TaxID=3365676 RepID=UPI0037D0B469